MYLNLSLYFVKHMYGPLLRVGPYVTPSGDLWGVVLAQDGTRKVVTFTDPEFDEDLQARLISWLD